MKSKLIVHGPTIVTTSTFDEFVKDSVELRNASPQAGSSRIGESEDSFYGDAQTFEVAVARCYDGYNARKVCDKGVEITNLAAVERDTPTMRFEGDDLDIPTFLSGDMRCFWSDVDDETNARKVHIVYGGATSCSVHGDHYLNHGGSIIALVNALDAMGVKVKVSVCFISYGIYQFSLHNLSNVMNLVTLKDYNEDIDSARLGACTHPSFFRRICFGMWEGANKAAGGNVLPKSGYGRAIEITNSMGVLSLNEEQFLSIVGIDSDENLILSCSPSSNAFSSGSSSANWVRESAAKISASGDRIIRI